MEEDIKETNAHIQTHKRKRNEPPNNQKQTALVNLQYPEH